MNEMKQLFAQVLDTPEPPLTSSETLLTTAHRSVHRRRLAWTTAASTGVLGLVVLAVSAGPTLIRGNDSGHLAGSSSSATPAATPSLPGDKVASPQPSSANNEITSGPEYDRANAMLAKLIALLPPGFTAPTTPVIATKDYPSVRVMGVHVSKEQNGSYHYIANTDAYLNGHGGSVSVSVDTGANALTPADDLCAQGTAHQGADTACHMVTTTSGTKVRLSRTDRATLNTYFAISARNGVTVTMRQAQASMAELPNLAELIYTEAQFAELATTAEFLP